MTTWDTIRADIGTYGEPVIRALELIQSLTGLGGVTAAESLAAVHAVMQTLEQGVGKLDAATILADLDKLAPSLAADDAAAIDANAAQLAKYPPPSTEPAP